MVQTADTGMIKNIAESILDFRNKMTENWWGAV